MGKKIFGWFLVVLATLIFLQAVGFLALIIMTMPDFMENAFGEYDWNWGRVMSLGDWALWGIRMTIAIGEIGVLAVGGRMLTRHTERTKARTVIGLLLVILGLYHVAVTFGPSFSYLPPLHGLWLLPWLVTLVDAHTAMDVPRQVESTVVPLLFSAILLLAGLWLSAAAKCMRTQYERQRRLWRAGALLLILLAVSLSLVYATPWSSDAPSLLKGGTSESPGIGWIATFGTEQRDWAASVGQTSDGGYIVVGYTGAFHAGDLEVYLIKTDSKGDEMWTTTFGGAEDDWGKSVEQTSDGGYIVAGTTASLGAGDLDVYLMKIDSEGDEMWSTTFGGVASDCADSVQQTSDGGYIIAGRTCSHGAGDSDVYLIKTDSRGDEVWSTTLGGSRADWARSVQQTSDGGYVVVGTTPSRRGDGYYSDDVYLIKTDSRGDEVWSTTFGGVDDDEAQSVRQTSDGGYIVAGTTESFAAGGYYDYDVYLIKTDSRGDEVWSTTFGGVRRDEAQSVRQTSDGGYIVAGTTESFGAGDTDIYLIRTDSKGHEMWSMTVGCAQDDEANSVQQTSDGGYVVVGYTRSGTRAHYDVCMIKIDPSGLSVP